MCAVAMFFRKSHESLPPAECCLFQPLGCLLDELHVGPIAGERQRHAFSLHVLEAQDETIGRRHGDVPQFFKTQNRSDLLLDAHADLQAVVLCCKHGPGGVEWLSAPVDGWPKGLHCPESLAVHGPVADDKTSAFLSPFSI